MAARSGHAPRLAKSQVQGWHPLVTFSTGTIHSSFGRPQPLTLVRPFVSRSERLIDSGLGTRSARTIPGPGGKRHGSAQPRDEMPPRRARLRDWSRWGADPAGRGLGAPARPLGRLGRKLRGPRTESSRLEHLDRADLSRGSPDSGAAPSRDPAPGAGPADD